MIETSMANSDIKSNEKNELLEKHPLQNTWTFWFTKHDRTSKEWEDGLKEITSFDTVEDFWAVYNHVEQPSQLNFRCDYNIFKQGIKPIWEDEKNMPGGHWEVEIKSYNDSHIDENWLDLILLMIGEGFDEHGDMINGAVIQMKGKNKKLSLWTNDASDENNTVMIGRKIRERLNLPLETKMMFRAHSKQYEAAIAHNGRYRQNEQFLYTC